MTTLSTHDTKRSEDVRARLLAGAAGRARLAWAAQSLLGAAGGRRGRADGYLLLQT